MDPELERRIRAFRASERETGAVVIGLFLAVVVALLCVGAFWYFLGPWLR